MELKAIFKSIINFPINAVKSVVNFFSWNGRNIDPLSLKVHALINQGHSPFKSKKEEFEFFNNNLNNLMAKRNELRNFKLFDGSANKNRILHPILLKNFIKEARELDKVLGDKINLRKAQLFAFVREETKELKVKAEAEAMAEIAAKAAEKTTEVPVTEVLPVVTPEKTPEPVLVITEEPIVKNSSSTSSSKSSSAEDYGLHDSAMGCVIS